MGEVKPIVLLLPLMLILFAVASVVLAESKSNDGPYVDKEGDFSLTIAVSSTSLSQGEDIIVEVTFKNLTGKRLEISHGTPLLVPFIVNSEIYQGLRIDVAVLSVLEIDEVIVDTWQIGSELSRGEYELVADAKFSLLSNPSQVICVVSNTIVLTVD